MTTLTNFLIIAACCAALIYLTPLVFRACMIIWLLWSFDRDDNE